MDNIVEPSSDHGTVLKANQAAIVFDEENGYTLLIPDLSEDDEIPYDMVFLAAILAKSEDEDWVEEIVREFVSLY